LRSIVNIAACVLWFQQAIGPARAFREYGETTMPLVTVNLIENVFSTEAKAEMITRLTDAMIAVEGEAMRPVTWVKIQEVPEGQWAIGGQPVTAAMVRQMQKASA
jgi:4-oxalocrotonate tautomerase